MVWRVKVFPGGISGREEALNSGRTKKALIGSMRSRARELERINRLMAGLKGGNDIKTVGV